VLDLTESVTEEDIRGLREKISPCMRLAFDAETNNTKMVLVALYRLGYENLVTLKRNGRPISILGTHDIKKPLAFILSAIPEIQERWKRDK
jgi:hypothetical protein